jgi:hypothetical protein
MVDANGFEKSSKQLGVQILIVHFSIQQNYPGSC